MELRIIGSGAIINDKKILLEKRLKHSKNYPSMWSLIGGQIDFDEELLSKTASREIKEETNLDFVPTEMFGFYENIDERMHSVCHVFLGIFSGDIKLKEDEVEEIRWFTYKEALQLDLAFGYKKAIEDLHERGLI